MALEIKCKYCKKWIPINHPNLKMREVRCPKCGRVLNNFNEMSVEVEVADKEN